MPNIKPEPIRNLIKYMNLEKCDIGTLASKLSSSSELEDQNVVKVLVKENMSSGMFKKLDFVRINPETIIKHLSGRHLCLYR